ncbi:MAG: GMC family oxidoreductase [Dehalococcoidia bacterium]
MVTTHPRVNVVTVGAGWTAAMLAWKLGEAGHNVVSIEQGPGRWANPGFEHNHDALRYHARHAMMVNLRKETWTWRPNPGAPSLPMRQYGTFNPGQGLGGAGVHWTAQLWRFHPYDLRMRSNIVERYGESKLPEGSLIRDWPVSYEELEPYYSQFEWDIGASGDADADPFAPPRSRPYRNPPLAVSSAGLLFERAARELGYHPFPFSSGIASRAFVDDWGNARGACLYCGFCTRYGCEVDAKASPLTTHAPVALRTGRWDVRTMSKVTQINLGADGFATGITYIDQQGEVHEQPADVVILTAFTLTNVRLLLLSKNDAHPAGAGNDRGWVGKHYTYQHFTSPWRGYFPGRRFNLYMGNGTTMMAMHDLMPGVLDHSTLDFVGGGALWSSSGERDPETTAGSYPIDGPDRAWGAQWKQALRDEWNASADIIFEGDSLPYEDQMLDLDPVYRADDGQPLLRITFDWHENDYRMWRYIATRARDILRQMGPAKISAPLELDPYNIHQYRSTHPTGGAIMGTGPDDSVCNSYGQVWDTPNLFVTGAAMFPHNPAANPTDTVAALTYRAGDVIRDRYFREERRLLA